MFDCPMVVDSVLVDCVPVLLQAATSKADATMPAREKREMLRVMASGDYTDGQG